MALSVKKFNHALNCPEPGNQINVTYHPTSSSELCGGGGTTTALFSYSNANLAGVIENTDTPLAANNGVCSDGMDVVFVIDYTGSMSGAIEGVKTGVSGLVSTINTQSGGNYRLGLVIFDAGGGSSTNYSGSTYYQNLPSAQKIIRANNTNNTTDDAYLYFTCVEKMSSVGNSTSFSNALNALNGTNSSTQMSLGSGGSGPEPGAFAIEEVADNAFAGGFRNGVQKLIILVTDNTHEAQLTYLQNTITPKVDAIGAQVMVNSSQSSNTGYTYLAQNTQPVGSTNYGLNFNGLWTGGLQQNITELCEETFTYTCDDLAIGWYMEEGTTTAYYWNGSIWSDSDTCNYTVTINLVDNITNGSVAPINSSHPNYVDSNTWQVSGITGQTFTLENTVYAFTDYTFGDITNVVAATDPSGPNVASIQTWTNDGNGNSNSDPLLNNTTFRVTGTIPAQDVTYNVTISGLTTANRYTMVVDIISTSDGLDSGESDGNIVLTPQTPATGWSDASSVYPDYSSALRRSFSGEVGETFNFDVNFSPNPDDYLMSITGATASYSGTPVQNAFSGNYTVDNTDINGSFAMTSGGGTAKFYIEGQIEQPDYTFFLTATENITGASISSGSGMGESETFTGYTGDTFPFTIQLVADAEYNSPNLTGTTVTGDSSAITTGPTVNNSTDRVTGVVTMPQGGGDANIEVLGGESSFRQYAFTVTINDPFDDTASWGTHTFFGAAGETLTATKTLNNQQSDTTYTISGVSDNSSALTSGYSGTNITLSLVMPSGGGSATVTVEGNNTATVYSYTVNFTLPSLRIGYGWGTPGTATYDTSRTKSIIVTGTAGSTHIVEPPISTGSSPFSVITAENWEATSPSVTESSSALNSPSRVDLNSTAGVNSISYGYTPSVSLTMPSGGGSGTVNCSMVAREKTYDFTITASTDSGNSSVVSPTQENPTGVTRTVNDNGTTTLVFNAKSGYSFDTVHLPVLPNNNTDYDTEIVNWTTSSGNIIADGYLTASEVSNYNGGDYEALFIDFDMPSLDPRVGESYNSSSLVINDTVTARTLTFTLWSSDSIANVGITPIESIRNYYGTVGSTHNWTSTYLADSGYTFNITSVTKSGTNSGSVNVTDSTGTNIGGTITMPSGGGSATVTANGTSSQITYTYTVTFSESVSNAAWRSTGTNTRTRSVTLAPGSSTTISEYIDASSGYSLSSLSYSDNSANLTGSANSSTGLVSVTVTMPSGATGNQSSTVSITGSTVANNKTLSVSFSESITGAFISSGYGSGAAQKLVSSHTGPAGTTGSETLYLTADVAAGYDGASITGVTGSNSNITGTSIGSSVGGGVGQAFTYSYQIPSSPGSSTVTVNGTANYPCTCQFLGFATAPTTWGGTNGRISVVVNESCTPPFAWTLNGVATTPTTVAVDEEYEFRNLSAGSYSVQLTDANGCTWLTLFSVNNPATTTQPPSETYYYYEVDDCAGIIEGGPWVARASYQDVRFTTHSVQIGQPDTPNYVTILREIDPAPVDLYLGMPSFCDEGDGGEGPGGPIG
jgi:hypothetical protein